jgi:hypothetical protein
MLYFELFKLDWLFIDTAIIIFLLLILLVVKFFKSITRWRYALSNISLSKIKIKSTYSNDKESDYSIKNIKVVRNMDLEDLTHPIVCIITFPSIKHSKLIRLITRGISSYGFDVINLKIKNNCTQYDFKEEKIQYRINELINSLNMTLQMNKSAIDSCLILYDTKSAPLAFKIFFEDKNNLMICINPDVNKMYKKTILGFLPDKEVNQKCLTIFSKKKLSIFSNKNLIKFLKLMPEHEKRNLNVKILEKSRKSFKYYETILLGIIIDFLDSQL